MIQSHLIVFVLGAGITLQGAEPDVVWRTKVQLDLIGTPVGELLKMIPALAKCEVRLDVGGDALRRPVSFPNYEGSLGELLTIVANETGLAFYISQSPQEVLLVVTQPDQVPSGAAAIVPAVQRTPEEDLAQERREGLGDERQEALPLVAIVATGIIVISLIAAMAFMRRRHP